ncbi:MAG: hypothetical protein WKF75_03760 [Singulisphaera sp.]
MSWAITAVEKQDYTNAKGKIVDLPNPTPSVTVNSGSASSGTGTPRLGHIRSP